MASDDSLSHDVRLLVGADRFEAVAWDGYEVTLDMLSAGSPWMFSFWRSRQWDDIKGRTRIGDPVTVTIDGAAQLEGVCEVNRLPTGRGEGARWIVAGRDYAGAAITAGADPTLVLRNVALEDALRRLFAPLNYTLTFAAGVEPTRLARGVRAQRFRRTPVAQRRELLDRVRPRVGEKVWAVADALCRRCGYLLWTAPGSGAGGEVTLRVDVPSTGAPVYTFTRREGPTGAVDPTDIVLETDLTFDGRDVPTTVTVFGENAQGDVLPNRFAREVTNGLSIDESLSRDRINPDRYPQPVYARAARARTPAAARQEASRIIADKNAGFIVYEVTVRGHGQRAGGDVVLYAPNQIAAVTDTLAGFDREPMLVTRVTFKGGRGAGQTTTLRMVPRGAIALTPGVDA